MQLSYRWQDLLGTGTYGKVFSAKIANVHKDGVDGHGETEVALKKARVTNHIRHPLLLHEACALTLLRGHPNIPRVLAWGRSQYFEYMAMELLGPNMDDVVSADGLSKRNAVIFICQMLDALEHIHSEGIVHGDVKPSNICLGSGENASRLYFIDFGLAWRWTSDTPPNGRRGTVPFSSLRVLAGEAPLPRDDLEALAYTTARLLTGNLPWGFQSLKERRDSGDTVRGRDVFQGYPDVFAQFVDFAHGLAPADDLQYQRWRDAFRALEPGLPERPMFDRRDKPEGLGRLWVSWAFDLGDHGFFLPEAGGDWDTSYDYKDVFGGSGSQSETGGDHGFEVLRSSEWLLLPFGLERCYTLGDEFDVVSRHMDLIDEPPLYDGGRSVEDTAPPEVMNNAQSDVHCIRP